MIRMPVTYEYLFQLISAAFTGQTPPEKPDEVSWEELFRAAKRQSVFMLAFDSVKRLQNKPNGKQLDLWQTRSSKLMTKSINQSVEIERLLAVFEREGIDVLPLKGYLLRDLYPHRELREMTDFDLLVKDDRSEKMKQTMKQIGYEFSADVDHHAGYMKKPYVVIELHTKLLPDRFGRKEYYRSVWTKAKCTDGMKHIYEMSPEDFLIYILLHFEKHYHNTGCGIRFLVDIHAILRSYGAKLDQAYLQSEFDKLGLREFTDAVFSLERAVFYGEDASESARELLERMIRLGTFGTNAGREENIIDRLTPKNGSRTVGKLRYYLRIVFPPVSEMKCSYPVVDKAKFLLPVFWLCRGVKTVFRNPKHISEHYQRIMSYGENKKK